MMKFYDNIPNNPQYQIFYIPSTFLIRCSIFDILKILNIVSKARLPVIREEPSFFGLTIHFVHLQKNEV